MPEEIYSEKYIAGGRTYFFDVKKTEGGNVFVHINETKRTEQGRERHEIVVFEEHLEGFAETVQKIQEYFSKG